MTLCDNYVIGNVYRYMPFNHCRLDLTFVGKPAYLSADEVIYFCLIDILLAVIIFRGRYRQLALNIEITANEPRCTPVPASRRLDSPSAGHRPQSLSYASSAAGRSQWRISLFPHTSQQPSEDGKSLR